MKLVSTFVLHGNSVDKVVSVHLSRCASLKFFLYRAESKCLNLAGHGVSLRQV